MNDLMVQSRESDLMMPIMDISTAIARRNQMVEFVSKIMVDGKDFGTIPGTGNKPTLLKAGAEKLTTFFGLRKGFTIVEKVEDWDKPFFYYHYRCGLYRGDVLIADGDGSCNSHESKYRYRQAARVCPSCNQPTIIKGKEEYGGGWLCWKKNGGCGAKFQAGDASIESQPSGKVDNPDVADQVNTIQKMAQKRALVAATLLAVNASEYFTQDIEDLAGAIDGEWSAVVFDAGEPEPPKQAQKQATPAKTKPAPQPAPVSPAKPARPYPPETLRVGLTTKAAKTTGGASPKQITAARLALMALVLNSDPDYRAVLIDLFNKQSSKELTAGECSALIDWSGVMDNDDRQPKPDAVQEVQMLLNDIQQKAGQSSLFAAEVQSGAAAYTDWDGGEFHK